MQCRHSSLELSTSALAFIKSHPLMHDCVDTVDSRPLYLTKHDEAFTQLAVDHVAQYTVFFLASSELFALRSVVICSLYFEPHVYLISPD